MKLRVTHVVLMLFVCCLAANCQPRMSDTVQNTEGFAVLELFTSQGCSSCPPADAILGKYASQNNPAIIPLTFHVDYWDRLGWKDRYGKKQFTARQQAYALHLGASVYTPQLVINGQTELVSSKENEVAQLVAERTDAKAPAAGLTIVSAIVINNQVKVNYKVDTPVPGIINAAVVRKQETTSIKRGENGGRKLTGYNIVIEFKTESLKKEGTILLGFDSKNLPADHKIIAYIQQPYGKILGVAQREISK